MSSKKPFDHIEEKIKQAVENSLPAFDEKAWQAMETKLDADKKKRRPVLWWFILPLVMAGGWAVYFKVNGSRDKVRTAEVTKADNKEENGNSDGRSKTTDLSQSQQLKTNTDVPGQHTNTDNNQITVSTDQQQAAANTLSQDPVVSQKNAIAFSKNKRVAGKSKGRLQSVISTAEAGETVDNKITGDENVSRHDVADTETHPDKIEQEKSAVTTGEQTNETGKQETKAAERQLVKKEEEEKPGKPEEKKKDSNKQSYKGWYLLAASGADAGSTKLLSFSNSNVTPKYGVGIGYRFNKRWSVQTGFYAANKKYVAAPGDYKIKPNSPMSAYQIEKIQAACLVYEIPVTVRYDIVNRPAFIFYVTASAESYIIQKEKYNCSYWYYDNIYQQEWKYSGNRHLFSTAMFSVGIEKPLSSKFSLLAEPSVSIPLSGVGDGKINLYSASALLGIKYYPFKK